MKTVLLRRDFLRASVAVGGGLLLAFKLPGRAQAAPPPAETPDFAPNAFVRVGRPLFPA